MTDALKRHGSRLSHSSSSPGRLLPRLRRIWSEKMLKCGVVSGFESVESLK